MADSDVEAPRKRQKTSEQSPTGIQPTSIPPEVTFDTSQLNMQSQSAIATADDEQAAKEREVGITAFVTSITRAFGGIVKKRYTDFLVNEILPNGQVLHLRNLKPPKVTLGNGMRHGDGGNADGAQPVAPDEPAPGVVRDGAGQVEVVSQESEHVTGEKDLPDAKPAEKNDAEISAEDAALLKGYFQEMVVTELLSLFKQILHSPRVKSRDLGTVKAAVTSDRSIRTKIHQDIRRIFGSRIDSSTDSSGAMILSAAVPLSRKPANQQPRHGNQRRQGKLGWAERGGEYVHFSIYKENKDTMEVISFLARQMKMNVKGFQFAGTKDRRGVTVQRASAYRVEAERLAGQNRMLRNSGVGDFEYHPKGLELGDLTGNEFVITLRDCHWEHQENLSISEKLADAEDAIAESIKELHERGYFNYYGLQRFGTFATRTDAVGIKLLQGDFKGACDAILAFSPDALTAAQDPASTEMICSEDKARAEAINIFQTGGKINEALDKMPRKYSAESNIIRHLGRSKTDYEGALHMIQRNLRLMYVHAYQSLVWNFAVGERWRLYGDRPVEGDLIMVNEHKDKTADETEANESVDADGEVVLQPARDDRAREKDDVFERARALSADEAASGAYSIFDVVLPLPGFDIIYPPNATKDFYKTFMASEQGGGLDPYNMRRKQKDYSLSGSYRKILARIEPGYEVEVRAYERDDEQFVETDMDRVRKQRERTEADAAASLNGDENHTREPQDGDKLAVIMKLRLGSSQYATMALRELMKGGATAYKPDFGGGR